MLVLGRVVPTAKGTAELKTSSFIEKDTSSSLLKWLQSRKKNKIVGQALTTSLQNGLPAYVLFDVRVDLSHFQSSTSKFSSFCTNPQNACFRELLYWAAPDDDDWMTAESFGKSQRYSGWWFQPIWKNISHIGSFPQVGMNLNNIWNHHLDLLTESGEKTVLYHAHDGSMGRTVYLPTRMVDFDGTCR